jgi:glyoxylate reductase
VARLLIARHVPEGSLDPAGDADGIEVVVRDEDKAYTRDELVELAPTVDGIVTMVTDRIDAEVLAAGKGRLRVVANVAIGVDNIDVPAATDAGVVVCNTPGLNEETTADIAFGLLLAAARRFSEAEADLRAGRWVGWEIGQYLGYDLSGATLGLVGYGGIGRAVGRRAQGFGMEVIHHTRTPTGEPGWTEKLHDLLARSDFVSLHIPLNAQSRHLIGRPEFEVMKPTAVLVNTARGPVVDEEALAEALEDGRIFAAGIDVYEREPIVHPRLLAAPRAVLLPHVGSGTVATRRAMATMAVRSAVTVLGGEVPGNALNPDAFRRS